MDTRRFVVRGGLLLVVGLVLVVVFDGFPLAHVGMLVSVAGAVVLLAVVLSLIID